MNEDIFHLGLKAIIKNKQNNILMLKTEPKLLKTDIKESFWEVPGGRIQKNSSIEETLKREVFEETGLTVSHFKPIDMFKTEIRLNIEGENLGLILGFFLCEVENSENIILSEEHTEYKWMEYPEAMENFEKKFSKSLSEKIKLAI